MARILVIEDNDDIRREIVDILSLEGYEVAQAENGQAGLTVASGFRPELILCDLMMPVLDGYGVLEARRADPKLEVVPVVFLTARTERVDMRRAMELGADDYLTKPFTAEELLGAVGAGVEKHGRLAREANRQMSSLREDLSAALPHELKTPLSCIMGYAELLTDTGDTVDRSTLVDFAERILGAGQRLNRMAENFLIYAQLELLHREQGKHGALPVTRAIVGDEIVARVARERARAHGRKYDLSVRLAPAPVAIGEGYLGRIVDELVDNALKFSVAGTPVSVGMRSEQGGTVLEVTDVGRGMGPAEIARVGAYVQFDRAVHEQQGLGLGLAISQRIATIFGGGLQITSAPTGGTTVRVTLPSAAAQPVASDTCR